MTDEDQIQFRQWLLQHNVASSTALNYILAVLKERGLMSNKQVMLLLEMAQTPMSEDNPFRAEWKRIHDEYAKKE
ncbi:MAG: hypothetical protein V4512_06830 [Pseudomonadota bacterium]